ncbi:MAG: DNA repair protein RecO [Bacillota bacterium]|nr:DNA repair protein RecO [Bacillota bacterium]
MIVKDQVIILKEVEYKDYHKIIHGFSRDNGKISFLARNARKPRNKNISPLKIFSYVDVVLYKGKGLPILNNSEIINNFYKINDDYNKYIYACYIAELLNNIVIEEPNEKIFEMVLKFFTLIEKYKDISNLVTGFELKLISILGFRPQLSLCVSCQSKKYKTFSINQGGLICSNCQRNDDYIIKINDSDIIILKEVLNSKFEEIHEMNIPINIKKLIRNYLMYHIDKYDFKSLKFLEVL